MTHEIDVLSEINLETVVPPKAIWSDHTVVIETLHEKELADVTRRRRQLREGLPRNNIVLEGRPGAGKSHFLGRVRRESIAAGDFFVAVQLNHTADFWHSVSLDIVESLNRVHGSRPGRQSQVLLHALLSMCGVADEALNSLLDGKTELSLLQGARRAVLRQLGRGPEAQVAADVAVALLLLNSDDDEHYDIGYTLFEGLELEGDLQKAVGLRANRVEPRDAVRSIDRLVAVSDRVMVMALDQLDGLIAVAGKARAKGDFSELNVIANDLMDLAQLTERTIVILSCIGTSWALIRDEAIGAARYRFPDLVRLGNLPTAECGSELISSVLGREFARLGYTPKEPTWPVEAQAFADAHDYTARGLLELVTKHLKSCVAAGRVEPLFKLAEAGKLEVIEKPRRGFKELDTRFFELKKAAKTPAIDDVEIETALPPLLSAGLEAFLRENAERAPMKVENMPEANPGVNARLRIILDAEKEDEEHWCFKVLAQPHGRAQCSRLKAAVTKSGLGEQRRLVVVRNTDWSGGKSTQAVLKAFEQRGGIVHALEVDDLRTLSALHTIFEEKPKELQDWLQARRPASGTRLLGHIKLPGAQVLVENYSEKQESGGNEKRSRATDVPKGHILIGHSPEDGALTSLPLVNLRRHVAVFAGSGSGKTVLLRRIIEECALAGVSSIVLDPNNDLARLGTQSPEPHPGWLDGDEARAERYAKEVEAVVWTPRLSGGRPLSFAPLAGLSQIDDKDEFSIAVDCAVELLAPRARQSPTTAKGAQGRAVLKQAAFAYIKSGHESLKGFFSYLSALPEGVSDLENAEKLAADMAQTLRAEAVNDPLFGDVGEALDPASLLKPSDGKRARVSIISLSGLPNQEQQQQFVSQLQLAVFTWIKKSPAGDRPLGGLFVMDEAQNFVPSGASTPSTGTTLALASQARKYGLGLIFATQAPKGLHNRVPGNCTTQVFGFLNASAQITAANELAATKGGRVTEISKLRPGQFYIAGDGLAFRRINTPFCLTHHPPSPLTQEEILRLAAQARAEP